MARRDKPLVWLRDEVKTPPFSSAARVEAGALLRRLQRDENLGMRHARPMSSIGRRCYELRIVDAARTWRIVCRLDADAIVIADVVSENDSRDAASGDRRVPATTKCLRPRERG